MSAIFLDENERLDDSVSNEKSENQYEVSPNFNKKLWIWEFGQNDPKRLNLIYFNVHFITLYVVLIC